MNRLGLNGTHGPERDRAPEDRDKALDRLVQTLRNLVWPGDAMTIGEMDGFVTGLLVHPEVVTASEWLQWRRFHSVTRPQSFPSEDRARRGYQRCTEAPSPPGSVSSTASARSFRPRALMTLSTVSSVGLRSPESAL